MKVILKKKCPSIDISNKVAQEFAKKFLTDCSNFSIFFEGGLGAGKSHMTREILKYLGISESIPSPTYTIMNTYTCPQKRSFAHFDFYRLENSEDFFGRGLAEIAEDAEVSSFIEWSERLPAIGKDIFSGTHFVVKIDHGTGVGMRNIKILN